MDPLDETEKHRLGQYFTTNHELKNKVFQFILNNPLVILEPSIGQGDLVSFIKGKAPGVDFDMYEIDETINLLGEIEKDSVIYVDFMKQDITSKYKTIVGNPPYIRTKNGNLYIDFVRKCYNLLELGGELIFIVPSDFFKLTSSSKLLDTMVSNGCFTHVFHPHNEKMFENASIDVIVFRYCKNNCIEKTLYNDKIMFMRNSNGLITFHKENLENCLTFQDYFNVYVGIVSGKDEIYKNKEIGNIEVISGENKREKFIYTESYPSGNQEIDDYLFNHKKQLIDRKMRKFNEKNWFSWGAPRNIGKIKECVGQDCIYVYNLTRKKRVSFVGKVDFFGGSMLILIPKKECNLESICYYINSDEFKENFLFSGRFKIGHRQLCNSFIPSEIL